MFNSFLLKSFLGSFVRKFVYKLHFPKKLDIIHVVEGVIILWLLMYKLF